MFEKSVLYAPGSIETPLSESEHREKWVSCVGHYLQVETSAIESVASELYDNGLQLEQYTDFSNWLQEIHKQLKDCHSKQTI